MATNEVRAVALWDGKQAHESVDLAWDGSRIAAVAPSSRDVREPQLSVIPGLIDTHVHLAGYAGGGSADWVTWPLITPWEEQVFHIAKHAQDAARGGVTTLRDLAGDERQLAVKRALDDGLVQGPRLLVHGAVGMTGGHGDLFIPPHYPHRAPVADSPDECRKLVRRYARAGVDGIKIFTSAGVLSMGDRIGWRNQTRAEIEATIDEAHALNLPVAAHSHTTAGNDIAIELGVDSIEHGTGLTMEQVPRILDGDISVAPTLMINNAIAEARIPVSEEAQLKGIDVVRRRDETFPAAGRAGVRFVLGTDANGAFVRFGDQMEEVRLMAELFGWTPAEALCSATVHAAQTVRLDASIGRLEPGYDADFVVMRGRPWERIEDLRTENIVAVVSRGMVLHGQLAA
ncbi:amidohydrolase family protein [Georgenia sp. H159]|uniref:metal-dependent hydrolase family protein n=1 Tax=Georgenia sp. H159 TaxID=3076115 RepID=UPI002D790385|nr:amidohydrolase family protein [Georgenia sp. H159]